MQSRFVLNEQKAKAAMLYIVKNTPGVDLYRALKILYFAEQNHLVKYGIPITGDAFFKKRHGPVAAYIYKKIKSKTDSEGLVYAAKKNNYKLLAHEDPDMDEFAESDLECLDFAISRYPKLAFSTLRWKSHDSAWREAIENEPIDPVAIAKAGGAQEAMLEFIRNGLNNFDMVEE